MSLNQGGGFVKSDTGNRSRLTALFSPLSYSTAPRENAMSPDPYPAVRLGFNPVKTTSTGKVSLQSADPYDHLNFWGTISPRMRIKRSCSPVCIWYGGFANRCLASHCERTTLERKRRMMQICLIAWGRGTVSHQCGTRRMGKDASCSVVDQRLKVHGIGRLRIVDASIFPRTTGKCARDYGWGKSSRCNIGRL